VAESRPVLDISTSVIIVGRLCVVASPLPFVIVAVDCSKVSTMS
jgi:hypothetical protein